MEHLFKNEKQTTKKDIQDATDATYLIFTKWSTRIAVSHFERALSLAVLFHEQPDQQNIKY